MSQFSFGIITPSYAADFERCKLLSESIEQFVPPTVTHYIIVDQRDLSLFRQLQKPNTEIVTVESILPWWIQNLPFVKNGWLNLKGYYPFIRNWHLQQLVKLTVGQIFEQDVFLFVDSDVFFVRDFHPNNLIRENQVRLQRIPRLKQPPSESINKSYQTAVKLLGIPPLNHRNIYIGNLIPWRRDNLLKLYQHIENISGREWFETLCSCWYIAEYVLYGVFVEHILQNQSGHYYEQFSMCKEYWKQEPLSKEELQKLFAEMKPHHVAVMISSKARMSTQDYQMLIKGIS